MADEMAAVRGMFEDVDFTAMSLDERTFTSLNSTYLAYGIAVGAILVLLVAVGLYLYDYYYGTSRTDPVEGNFEYNQYYTDADAYQQALYEYQQAQAQYQSRYYFFKEKISTFTMYTYFSLSHQITLQKYIYMRIIYAQQNAPAKYFMIYLLLFHVV